MTFAARAVTVAATATRLDSTGDHPTLAQSFTVYNAGSVTVYIGGSDVTTATGWPVPAGAYGPATDLYPGETVYGIVASGTAAVRVLESAVSF